MAERIRRSVEERIAEIDKKIESHKANIATLEEKKKVLLSPKPRKRVTKAVKIKNIIDQAKKTMTPEEIAEKLGIPIDEQ